MGLLRKTPEKGGLWCFNCLCFENWMDSMEKGQINWIIEKYMLCTTYYYWLTMGLNLFWNRICILVYLCWQDSRTTDTQWRHKSKKPEILGRCGRQHMLWPYLFGIWFSWRPYSYQASVVHGKIYAYLLFSILVVTELESSLHEAPKIGQL